MLPWPEAQGWLGPDDGQGACTVKQAAEKGRIDDPHSKVAPHPQQPAGSKAYGSSLRRPSTHRRPGQLTSSCPLKSRVSSQLPAPFIEWCQSSSASDHTSWPDAQLPNQFAGIRVVQITPGQSKPAYICPRYGACAPSPTKSFRPACNGRLFRDRRQPRSF